MHRSVPTFPRSFTLHNKPKTGTATDAEGIPDGWLGLDSGPKSNALFRDTVLEAKTILWNGYAT